MARRSRRLGAVEQEDDRISNSSVESNLLYRESPARTLRKKITNIKRAPTIHQPTQHSYYSETSTYISRDLAGASLARRETDYEGSNWGDSDLVRKRMGSESSYTRSKKSLLDTQATYDKSTSSSGYSSEEDYMGQSQSDEDLTRASWWRSWSRSVAKLPWLLFSFPGHLFGLLYWWFGTTWYRLTTSAALLDVFILTRHYTILKKALMILLFLLLLALVGTGLWYFYPYGLQDLFSMPLAVYSRMQKPINVDILQKEETGPREQPLSSQSELISKMESLERRFQGLEKGLSKLHQQDLSKHTETNIATAAGLSREEIVQVFMDLSSSREESLREGILLEAATRTKNDLRILREEQKLKLQEILQNMHQMSKDIEGQILQLRTEFKSPAPEELRDTLLQEVDKLEGQLLGLHEELKAVKKTQSKVSREIEAIPGHIHGVRDEVEFLFPTWLMAQLDPENGGARPLSEIYLRQDELQKHLMELERKILAGMSTESKQWTAQAHNTIDRELLARGLSGISREEVHDIVNRALQRYSEDRIGLVDYALESSGASVINTRCSETFETKTALLSLFGIPLWYQSQSPRVILQPDSNPGNCWAFRGSQGYAVIRLSSRIRPTAVTLDHIPRSLSPKATISSAPKDFSVYGLEEETQKEGALLGNFTYNQYGNPIQTFHIQGEDIPTYQLVELRIQSNWGHPEYTCIYRFRVHGETEL